MRGKREKGRSGLVQYQLMPDSTGVVKNGYTRTKQKKKKKRKKLTTESRKNWLAAK